ncbi:uncharacterized protein MONOS_6087 [Monocercomonoides exilis]|uniref:uncharacterized protein n=1 Tax=Monocercomonoides exilis TaxID=2049356 RepID=UPI00355A5B77|nr:hypothetical protein MONOS_6087 [Monocercomonoides exilis]|eukprot:MONOS_6087.1-p1 / transcript=MONOS_6087.1 / gene=MONOS_6087 / organism=Monocercomonoides_exilis_PA203 / gene_product=unspecified product / transcript_product=unspecified product / location=Mono_scaffold00187:53420-54523(-) / protein_length=292 / sequence_SO=supercontig / SO=protein_coding / is_pseudo=false
MNKQTLSLPSNAITYEQPVKIKREDILKEVQNVDVDLKQEKSTVNEDRVQCQKCGRLFFSERIKKHESVCHGRMQESTKRNSRASLIQAQTKPATTPNHTTATTLDSQANTLGSSRPRHLDSKISSTENQKGTISISRIPRLTSKVNLKPKAHATTSASSHNLSTPKSRKMAFDPLSGESISRQLNILNEMEKTKSKMNCGLLVYLTSPSGQSTCLGELLYEKDATIVEELSLLVEDQLGARVKPDTMKKNGVIQLHKQQYPFSVSSIFRKDSDYLLVEPYEDEADLRIGKE